MHKYNWTGQNIDMAVSYLDLLPLKTYEIKYYTACYNISIHENCFFSFTANKSKTADKSQVVGHEIESFFLNYN